jgi:hypothetical protein
MTRTVHPSAIVSECAEIFFINNKVIIADNCNIQNDVSVRNNVICKLPGGMGVKTGECLDLKSLGLLVAKHHSARDHSYASLRLNA